MENQEAEEAPNQHQRLIEQLDLKKAELDAYRPLPAETLKKIRSRIDFEWNYHSNAIEGNRLDENETRLLLSRGLTAQGKPLKDHLDIQGHKEAIEILEEYIQNKNELSNYFIQYLHQTLLKEPYEVEAIDTEGNRVMRMISIGKYKKFPNNVKTQSGSIFHFTPPEFVDSEMVDLIDWYREAENKIMTNESLALHPVDLASELHYRFVRIHPFDDGNGRMARLLMNFCLMRLGFPPAVIESENKQRGAYYEALSIADETGNLQTLALLVGKAALKTLDLSLAAARGESIGNQDDWKRKLKLVGLEYKSLPEEEIKKIDKLLFEARLSDSFIPLLKELDQVAQGFSDFFESIHSVCYTDRITAVQLWQSFDLLLLNERPTSAPYMEIDKISIGFFEKFIENEEYKDRHTCIEYRGVFHRVKKFYSLYGMDIHFKILLEDYSYRIMSVKKSTEHGSMSHELLNIPHIRPLTPDEINKIASAMGQYLTDMLEDLLKGPM